MKLAMFKSERGRRVGAVKGDWVVDIAVVLGLIEGKALDYTSHPELKKPARRVLGAGPPPSNSLEVIERGEDWIRDLDGLLDSLMVVLSPTEDFKGVFIPVSQVSLCAPIPRPSKIVCVGRNYAEHAQERGAELPPQPIYFLKSSNTICGPGDPIVLPPNSAQVDYEAELAVVIGKSGRRIREEDAYDYVVGYTILNDVSARDMQRDDKQWFRGKSCDTFAPTGPWIVTRDELSEPHNLRISLTLNNQTMQDSNTGKMIFKIPHLISYLSQSLTWEVGDLLSTGTPEGVGAHRAPPIFLKAGDTVSITVERIGTLTNPVVGPDTQADFL